MENIIRNGRNIIVKRARGGNIGNDENVVVARN